MRMWADLAHISWRLLLLLLFPPSLVLPLASVSAGGTCSPIDNGISSYPQSDSNTAGVAGTCDAGYTKTGGASPTRDCNTDLSWGDVSNECTRTPSCACSVRCGPFHQQQLAHAARKSQHVRVHLLAELTCATALDSTAQATFPTTLSGASAVGTCTLGYAATGGVSPTRTCKLSGAWSSTTGSCTGTRNRSSAAHGLA